MLLLLDLTVGGEEIGVGKGLRGFHGPEAVALEVFEGGVSEVGSLGEAFNGVAYGMGEGGGAVGLSGLVECLNGFAGDEGPGGVVNEYELGVLGQSFQRGEDGLLPGGASYGIGDLEVFVKFFGDL